MAGTRTRENGGNENGRDIYAGEIWREKKGGRKMAGTKWRENYDGRNMAGEEGRERETNSDQELHRQQKVENSRKISSPIHRQLRRLDSIFKNKICVTFP